MNDMTSTRYCSADLAAKLDADIHPWLLSEREGGNRTTLSYVKIDVLTDTLNKLFGPLGWGVEAKVQKMEDFQYEKPGYQGAPASEWYVFQVISEVTLTIKSQTADGSDTVFKQSGIGYGEVKINAHRKDAVGMAVKGAESDGLKRCCNFLGRALGMFLVGGKQDPVVYAHNGNKNKTVVQKALRQRDDWEWDQRQNNDGDGKDVRDGRGNDVRQHNNGGRGGDSTRDNADRQQDNRGRSGNAREDEGRDAAPRNDRARDDRPHEDQPRQDRSRDDRPRQDRSRDNRSQDDQPNPDRQGDQDRRPANSGRDERGAGRQDKGEASDREAGAARGDDQKGKASEGRTSQDGAERDTGEARGASGDKDGKKPEVKAKRKAETNYDLRKVPVTREHQTDFAATFVRQIEGMRQAEDQVQMMKTYVERINDLDPDIRSLLIERLREKNVDVALLD